MTNLKIRRELKWKEKQTVSEIVCYQVSQSFLKAGTSAVGWPGSLSHCVAVTCSLEMDVFDMDAVKVMSGTYITVKTKQNKKNNQNYQC